MVFSRRSGRWHTPSTHRRLATSSSARLIHRTRPSPDCSTACAPPSRPPSSRRTEEAYVAWIRRYIFFHDKRHPAEMGAPEVTAFLTALAVDGQRGGVDPEPGTERVALPVPGGARGQSALARRHRTRKAARSLTRRPHARGGPRGAAAAGPALRASWPASSTAPDCACWSAAAFASRTSTSLPTRSWYAAARATRTA